MTMKNKKRQMVYSFSAIVLVAIGITMTVNGSDITAEESEPMPVGRFVPPFHFVIPDKFIDGERFSGKMSGSAVANLAKGDVKTLPIEIRSRTLEPQTIKLHAAFGTDHRGDINDNIKQAPHMSVVLEPSEITLEPKEKRIVNLQVSIDPRAQDGLYYYSIVGQYDGEKTSGGSVYLKVGKGSEHKLYPRDFGL